MNPSNHSNGGAPKSTGRSGLRTVLLVLSFTLLQLSSGSVSALLVGDDGRFEPIIVQINESLRTSTDLDNQLTQLDSLRQQLGLTTLNWWAGPKLLVMYSFPAGLTQQQAQSKISLLQQSTAAAKVVVQSASNLEFNAADFSRVYGPTEAIPDEARRGFDWDRIAHPRVTYDPSVQLPPYVANRIIVHWKDEFVWSGSQTNSQSQFDTFNAQAGCAVVEERSNSNHDLTQILAVNAVPDEDPVVGRLLFYQASNLVDYVQPDYIYESQTVPNDPIYVSQQWSLPKISAPSAWSLTTGSDSVVLAITDTGANIAHPDFAPNLWSGQNNGDIHNFVNNTTNVYDDNGHGSNVASIAGAQGNNGLYMTGVSWNAALMHLKVLDALGSGTTSQVTAGIDYARTHGASAINISLGLFHQYCYIDGETHQLVCEYDYMLDPVLFAALGRARDSNVVAVCAAGNGLYQNGQFVGQNTDSFPFSPASVPTDNTISVAASDQNDNRPGFSDFGVKTVDLAAPGVSIYGLKATYNGNSNDLSNYTVYTGTSQATPHVTGTIGLIKAKFGWENYHGVRDRVLMGTDDLTSFSTLVRTGGRLNANKSLQPRTLIRNLSTRARVENGDRIMIGGFTIGGSGTGTLKVAIRGLGPSLPSLGVAKLNNPTLQLNNSSGNVIYSNSDWGTLPTAQKSDLSANGLTPTDSREAAMVQTLAPGSYTVFLQSQDGVFGVGLFEIYELQGGTNQQTRLLNVSTRCLVRTGNEQAIAGTILGDPSQSTNTTIPKRSILMFGKGPSLPSSILGRLANPFLTLKNSAGTQMSANDSWANATASVVKAATSLWTNVPAPVDELTEANLGPTSALESALWPILKSGTYTATLSGVSGGTGVALLEMYEY